MIIVALERLKVKTKLRMNDRKEELSFSAHVILVEKEVPLPSRKNG